MQLRRASGLPDPAGEPVAAATQRPLDDARFAAALAPLVPDDPRRVAVAVSGGADSVALLLLMARWASTRRVALVVLSVDHCLRSESGAEARWVADLARRLDLPCEILAWTAPKPASGLPAAARAARYRLLLEGCRRHGAAHLALAHHRDDQAETVLLNLGRGSGVDGLAAMPALRRVHGIALLRPLLDVDKACLRATLRAAGQDWLEDPTNRDPRFLRPRLREVAPALAAAGVTPARIAGTARRMARARAALEAATDALSVQAARRAAQGHVLLHRRALAAAPDEIALRLLARLIRGISGAVALREERLERLLAWVQAGPGSGGRTLGGCRVVARRDELLLCRELAAVGPDVALAPGDRAVWDGRFVVALAPDAAPGVVRPLGPRAAAPGAAALPGVVRAGLPALWSGDRLVAAPLAGLAGGGFDATLLEPAGGGNIVGEAVQDDMVSCLARTSAYLYGDGCSIVASPPTLNVACG
ncbi:tRNA lysidine(34) synthetase TilS [Zavarzinia sp. CC-PAN008]|uniref:tRNA lysidine(34) synthetase TilS n=1 Tax=Zavarzinia sp. CC-PAN008 TaxID=3243332 RepID=UPI003F74A924